MNWTEQLGYLAAIVVFVLLVLVSIVWNICCFAAPIWLVLHLLGVAK